MGVATGSSVYDAERGADEGDVGAAADPAFVWSSTPGPPGALGCDGIDRPAPPPAPASPGVASAAAATGGKAHRPVQRDDPTGPEGCVRGPGKDATVHAAHSAGHIDPVARRGDPRARPHASREPRRERSIYYWGNP